jgi:type IV secretory pathway VirB3-like protein
MLVVGNSCIYILTLVRDKATIILLSMNFVCIIVIVMCIYLVGDILVMHNDSDVMLRRLLLFWIQASIKESVV